MPEPPRVAQRVLLIGWDGADWKLIDKLIQQGAMPHTQQFLERGSRGNLATLQPVLSPMLWNSIATGKRAHKHGIHGFTEPMPDGKGVRPSSSTSRSCKSLWNILTQQGMTANVVSWFCSHPAEPISGIYISEMFQKVKLHNESELSALSPLADDCLKRRQRACSEERNVVSVTAMPLTGARVSPYSVEESSSFYSRTPDNSRKKTAPSRKKDLTGY